MTVLDEQLATYIPQFIDYLQLTKFDDQLWGSPDHGKTTQPIGSQLQFLNLIMSRFDPDPKLTEFASIHLRLVYHALAEQVLVQDNLSSISANSLSHIHLVNRLITHGRTLPYPNNPTFTPHYLPITLSESTYSQAVIDRYLAILSQAEPTNKAAILELMASILDADPTNWAVDPRFYVITGNNNQARQSLLHLINKLFADPARRNVTHFNFNKTGQQRNIDKLKLALVNLGQLTGGTGTVENRQAIRDLVVGNEFINQHDHNFYHLDYRTPTTLVYDTDRLSSKLTQDPNLAPYLKVIKLDYRAADPVEIDDNLQRLIALPDALSYWFNLIRTVYAKAYRQTKFKQQVTE